MVLRLNFFKEIDNDRREGKAVPILLPSFQIISAIVEIDHRLKELETSKKQEMANGESSGIK